tara:strand:+ start:97 stop:690 length:594 start_codon:yes stop_codon:yes gene_type:complete
MALFKPEQKEAVSFNGVCECAIIGFEDKSNDYEWADQCIRVTVKQKGSSYTRTLDIKGDVEKTPDGVVTGGNFFNRLYRFLTTIGWDGGLNIKGEWEDSTGNAIDDIADYLTSRFAVDENNITDYPYLGYFYKSVPNAAGDSYNRALGVLEQNNGDGRKKLNDDVAWRKSKGYLKEYDPNAPVPETADLGEVALENL